MPSQIGSLFVSLTADFASFQRNMRSAEGVVASTATGMRRHMGLTEKSVSSFQRSVGQGVRPYALISAARAFDTVQQRANLLRGALFATTAAFGGLGAALTTNVVSRYLDQFTGLENQMRVVASGSADLAAKMSAVQDVAARSRASLAAVATLYSRISKSAPTEAPQAILRRVETINKALQLGGATAQEAASAAIQFSQAIASNRLGGEELRAVLETPLGLELAKGLGVSIGVFRKMGTAGELTAEVLFKSLDKISGTIDNQFAKSLSTIDQALTVADAKITAYAGSLDDAYGITKLITGSIGGFANNLETIIPLLASAAAGMGILFAGRLAGGIVGKRYAEIATGIRGITAARKDDLRAAKEEVAQAQRSRSEATDRVTAARSAVAGNVLGMAPKSEIKAYQRDLAVLEKADARRLALLHQKADVTTRLGEVYKTTTVGEMRAAQALADQQVKLNALYDDQRRLKLAVSRADAAVTGGAGLSSQAGATLRTQADAQKALNDLTRQQGVIAKAVAREEQQLGAMRQNIQNETSSSFLRTANERASILVKEKALTRDLIRNDQERANLVNKARASRGIAVDSGMAVAGKGLSDASLAATSAERSVARAREAMLSAGRAAGLMSTGLSVVRAAGGSLVGFLGGPWGVAFTSAIALLTIFGLRARAAAEEVARAQQIIKEELDKASQGIGVVTPEEQQSILEGTLIAETERRASVLKELERVRDEIVTGLKQNVFSTASFLEAVNETANPTKTVESLYAMVDAFGRGEIKIQAIRDELVKLGVDTQIIDVLVGELQKTENQGDLASFAIERITKAMKSLQEQIANAKTNITGSLDPLGTFSGKGGGLDPVTRTLAKQNELYGVASISLREQNKIVGERNRLLEESRDIDDKIVTAIQMQQREQQLLEAGVARTREEAHGLAMILFGLEGRLIDVTVQLNVLDPLGVFKSGYIPGLTTSDELIQRKQYGVGQVASRDQMDRQRRRESTMAAAGEENKIANTPQKIRDRAQALLEEENAFVRTRVEAEAFAKQELDLAEKTRLAGQAAGSAAKDYESFANKLAELKEQGDAAFLTELDQKVVAFAKSLKDGSEMMRQYIEAVNSGDMTKAPKELLEARDALMKIGAAGTWRDILQKYGDGAQLADQFAEKQAELNYLVSQGKITAGQASLAYADFLGQFGEYEWINDLSGAFTDFARSAITDFENIGDAAKSLLQRILDIILQMTVLKPLEESLRSSFAQSATGGGGLGGFFKSLFGGGGKTSPLATAAVASGAGGLFASGGWTGPGGKNKPAGVVHAGEYVFDKNSTSRIGVGTLEAMQRGGMPGYASGGKVGKISYDNHGKRRNIPSSGIVDKVHAVANEIRPGTNTSLWAGQEPKGTPPAGKKYRHPLGFAGDFDFYDGDTGKRIYDRAFFKELSLEMARQHNANIGYDEKTYMKAGRIHIDTLDISKYRGLGAQWGRTAKSWAKELNAARKGYRIGVPGAFARPKKNIGLPEFGPIPSWNPLRALGQAFGITPKAPKITGSGMGAFPSAPKPLASSTPIFSTKASKVYSGSKGSGKGPPSFSQMSKISPSAAKAIASGGGGLYHSGGVVGSSSRFRPPGSKMLRDEVPAILRKGEVVASSVAQARQGERGGSMPVTIVNNGARVSAEKRVGGNGMPSLHVMVDNMMSDVISRRGTRTNQTLDHGFGLKPTVKRVF